AVCTSVVLAKMYLLKPTQVQQIPSTPPSTVTASVYGQSTHADTTISDNVQDRAVNQKVTPDSAEVRVAAAVVNNNIEGAKSPPASRATPIPISPQVKVSAPIASPPPLTPTASSPPPVIPADNKTALIGTSVTSAYQLETLIHKRNPSAPNLSSIYFKMQGIYGIRADLAFLQMVKETNSLKFTGDVSIDQHNPAGLGAVGGGAQGMYFNTWEEGIEAQFQHLYAYACENALPAGRIVYDQRFKYVRRGYAPYVEWLGADDNPQNADLPIGQRLGWAVPGDGYGASIIKLVKEALTY
ncbi:MAG TPA: hypothetical protein VFF14_04165, partial [Candidatus Deferrimicrobium sp.]|nr:hypothetical protein [Candidatus Deferrimicrobium sp.]